VANAVAQAPNSLFVVAAGNESSDNDSKPTYPCNTPGQNVVCVAASDQNDALAGFSNFGAQLVDLAAPGTNVLSTYGSGYAFLAGTSMATPHVAGVAALIRALRPDSTPAAVRSDILSTVEQRPGLVGRTVTGGRLDADGALAGAPEGADPAPQPVAGGSSPSVAPDAPAPVPALAPARDTIAPSFSVTIARGQTLRTIRSRGLKLSVRCDEGCDASAALSIDPRTARTLGLSSRPVVIGRATRVLRQDQAEAFGVRLTRSSAARLARAPRARLVLRMEVEDAGGNRRLAVRSLSLKG
jgi:hypothetical protein